MKLYLDNKDISQILERIQWSGSMDQITRRVSFSYAYEQDDYYLPKIVANEGEKVVLCEDSGAERFTGIVTSVSFDESSSIMAVGAVDFLWYTAKNKAFKVYTGTPQAITKTICAEFGIPVGELAQVNAVVTVTSTGDKTVYEVIKAAYSGQGTPYKIGINGTSLTVKASGSKTMVLEYLNGATYTSSIEDMINCVAIIDKDSNGIGKAENSADLSKFGVLQEVYKKEDGKDASTEAKKLLKSAQQTVNISHAGHFDCVSGNAVSITNLKSKITGKFLIQSDTHSFEQGQHMMTLALLFMEVA